MNDLEDRLRADFLRATTGVEDTIDAEAALLAGQRARSSRRIGATVGITAMAVVAGLVGWTVLRVVPIQGGLPSPLGTISAVPSRPATPNDPLSTTFDLTEGLGRAKPGYDSITVSAVPAGSTITVTLSAQTAGKQAVERDFTVPSGKVWYVPWDQHLVIGIVPDRAAWLDIEANAQEGMQSNDQPIEGIGATAFWAYFAESGASDSVRGVIWEGSDQVIRDSTGAVVPSARLDLANGGYLVYRDAALNTLGVRTDTEAGNFSTALDDPDPSFLVHGGYGTKPDGKDWIWSQAGVLPPGSRDIAVQLAAQDGDWGTATLDDGWVALVAWVRTPDEAADVITSLSYTDADGKPKHYPK